MSSTRTPTSTAERADLLATARALATDGACAEVVSAWRARGIDSVLVKGATTASWLYQHEARGYADGDLLVDPARIEDARDVLAELGFAPAPGHFSDHAHPWVRSFPAAVIDLHTTLWGATRAPERVWAELRGWTQPIRIGLTSVAALSVPARALHLALHAAQHGDSAARRGDLRRALERTSLAEWQAAEQLAERIWALPMMAVGLSLEPAGNRLLGRLPLARAGLLAERRHAPLAIGFARLRAAKGVRAKAAVLGAALVPDRDDHARMPFARRLGWLLCGLPRTLLSLARDRPFQPERI